MAGASTRSAWLSEAPWGAGGAAAGATGTLGYSEIRPVTVQNREFPPLRAMYVLTFDNKVRLPQEV